MLKIFVIRLSSSVKNLIDHLFCIRKELFFRIEVRLFKNQTNQSGLNNRKKKGVESQKEVKLQEISNFKLLFLIILFYLHF